jgi:phosphoserine phosphatase
MDGPAKAEAVGQLAVVEGLDLARCAAYSDSANDLPLLSAVGRAVAVNPDGTLLRQARQHGWEVRDFRTGRRAVKIAVPSTAAAGLVAGAVTAGLALQRRRRAG